MNMQPKTAIHNQRWIAAVGCGPKQAQSLEVAHQLGYKVLGIDRNPFQQNVDYPLAISTYSSEKVVSAFIDNPCLPSISGVIGRVSGPAISTINLLAKLKQLPGPGTLLTECCISKWSLHQWCLKNGLKTIRTSRRAADDNESSSMEDLESVEIIIKPCQPIYGKKNVYRTNTFTSAKDFLEKACAESLDGHAIVQDFIDGIDIGIITACVDGLVIWSHLFQEFNDFDGSKIRGLGVGELKQQISYHDRKEILQTCSKLAADSRTTGFACFSFRKSNQGEIYLYESNFGLCGDGIVENLLSTTFPSINFIAEDIYLATTPSKCTLLAL